MSFLQIIGNITPPEQLTGTGGYGPDVTGQTGDGGGLIGLVSNIIKAIMVVGGVWAFINFVIAGITFVISADKPDDIKAANSKMTNSLIGLVIMTSSFVIAGLIGYLLYGNAGALLNPTLYGPGS
jgi:uncharacterized membrane protein